MSDIEKKTQESKPQETKSQEKKAPAQKKRTNAARPAKTGRPFKKGAPFVQKPVTFVDSLEDRFPALAAKLKKQVEDGIKRKIKDAQSDPKVQKASAKYGAN
ncbi:MAG TPA: hypothetical protein GX724_02760 [Fibrobacter sp.]|nr:hypothetical protein [Fibrobacter sp.]